MWKENDELLRILDNDTRGKEHPLTCPACNEGAVHIYFHRFDENDEYGAGWVWCSKCESYVHMRYQIPSWWKNLDKIDEDMLEDSPEYLNGFDQDIDKLWNNSVDKE